MHSHLYACTQYCSETMNNYNLWNTVMSTFNKHASYCIASQHAQRLLWLMPQCSTYTSKIYPSALRPRTAHMQASKCRCQKKSMHASVFSANKCHHSRTTQEALDRECKTNDGIQGRLWKSNKKQKQTEQTDARSTTQTQHPKNRIVLSKAGPHIFDLAPLVDAPPPLPFLLPGVPLLS